LKALHYFRPQVDAFAKAGAAAVCTLACFAARALAKIVCFERILFLSRAVGSFDFQIRVERVLCFRSTKFNHILRVTLIKKWE